MLKPDSKYCRYCDICKKECKSYLNKNLDISNSEKSNNEISNNDLSFNDISDVVGLKKYLIDNKYLHSFLILILTLAILVIFLSYDNFKQLNIIKSFFITENKYNLTKQNLGGIQNPNINQPTPNINLPTPNINLPTPNINLPTPNINLSKANIEKKYKSIFL